VKLGTAAAGVVVGLATLAQGSVSGADSFTPVRLAVSVSPVARAHVPLPITVRVSADAGALDDRTAPLRVRIKLSSECGGTYQYTSGVVLVDKRLNPQPTTGRAYSGSVKGHGRPSTYGQMTVCTWLEEEGDHRVFAQDSSVTVNVSRACTTAAARYDAARRRHGSRSVLRARRRRARRACGPGVTL
jgi:hypothetical protein